MVLGAVIGNTMNRLYYSEEKKLREKQMVQRLRNADILPSAHISCFITSPLAIPASTNQHLLDRPQCRRLSKYTCVSDTLPQCAKLTASRVGLKSSCKRPGT
jgi:hypothetical protein